LWDFIPSREGIFDAALPVSDRKKGGTSARAKIAIPPIFPFQFPLLIKERILELVVGGPVELSKVVYLL